MSVASEEVSEQIVEKTKGPIDLTDEPLVEITRDPASFISGPQLGKGGSIARNVLEFQLVNTQHSNHYNKLTINVFNSGNRTVLIVSVCSTCACWYPTYWSFRPATTSISSQYPRARWRRDDARRVVVSVT